MNISKKEEAADSTDMDTVSEYAIEAISAMQSAGIINGYPDGSIRPKESASRAVTAVLVHRVLMSSK